MGQRPHLCREVLLLLKDRLFLTDLLFRWHPVIHLGQQYLKVLLILLLL